jgi:hypothetical protein
MHPLLRYSFTPTIHFNLLHHPSSITTLPDHRPPALLTFTEPATSPPLPSLTIISPPLPWSIIVHPQRPNKFVTVSDVLLALHRALSLPAAADYYDTPPPHDTWSRATAAFEHRVQTLPNWHAQEGERVQGVRRIDFLRGRTCFLGLSRMGKDPGLWVLSAC